MSLGDEISDSKRFGVDSNYTAYGRNVMLAAESIT
jgi:hypothetical protein